MEIHRSILATLLVAGVFVTLGLVAGCALNRPEPRKLDYDAIGLDTKTRGTMGSPGVGIYEEGKVGKARLDAIRAASAATGAPASAPASAPAATLPAESAPAPVTSAPGTATASPAGDPPGGAK